MKMAPASLALVFAGVVGAHNGIMAYGNRTGLFQLQRVHATKNFQDLIHTYFGLKLPHIKIAVTGSGRVAHGILEIMNLLGVHDVEPEDYVSRNFSYPVYVHLKGGNCIKIKPAVLITGMIFIKIHLIIPVCLKNIFPIPIY